MKRALFLLVALAACAKSPAWQKDGASEQTVAADLKLCEASAPLAPRPPPGPRGRNPASSTIDFDSMAAREGDRFLKDQRHVGECMRAKGYRQD